MSASRKPLISIGLSTYNRGSVIVEAIDSLLKQSYKNIELIILDASTDNTEEICRRYEKKDKRVRYFHQKKKIGLANSYNFVLSKGRGKYFLWAADDDIWHKDFITILFTLLEKHPTASMAFCNYILFTEDKKIPVRMKLNSITEGASVVSMYLNQPVMLICSLFRTDILKKTGGFHLDNRPVLQSWGSDNVTVLKALLEGGLLFSKKTLFYKRDSGYCLNRYEHLQRLNINNEVVFRVKRYLQFPIAYVYDWFYSTKYIWSSRFSFLQKVLLSLQCIRYFSLSFLDFARTIITGFLSVGKGILRVSFRV